MQGGECVHSAPVELHTAAYPVGAGSEHYHCLRTFAEADVVAAGIVAQVEVVRFGRELSCKGVDLLDERSESQTLASFSDELFLDAEHSGNLYVGETLALYSAEELPVYFSKTAALFEEAVAGLDIVKFVEEPLVDFGELVDAVHAVSALQGGSNCKDACVGRIAEGIVKVFVLIRFVADEAVGTLSNHTQTLLNGFLEIASYRHYFTHALHAGTDFSGHTLELGEVPARDLADHVVQRRFEKGRGGLGDGILQLKEAVAQT